MNLAELRARVRDLTDMRQTTLVPDATIDSYINETLIELLGSREWPFLFRTIVQGSIEGSCIVGFTSIDPVRAVKSVVMRDPAATDNASSQQLQPARHEEFEVTFDGEPISVPGTPTRYVADILGMTRIVLDKAPTTPVELAIRVLCRGTGLEDDYSEPELFAAEYHLALAYGAAARLLTRESDSSGRIEAYGSEYTSLVSRMVRDYMVADDNGPFIIGFGNRPVRNRSMRWGS